MEHVGSWYANERYIYICVRGDGLRHCISYRKVAGSILDWLIRICHRRNPSGRTTALGSNQPLTEMSTSVISWGAG